MREKRKREIKNRKNFLPSILWTLLLWIFVGLFIYFLDPDTIGVIPIFFMLLFTSLLFSFSLVLANTRRGLIAATALTLFLILRYFGIGNLLNGFLLLGVTLASEIYFWYSEGQK